MLNLSKWSDIDSPEFPDIFGFCIKKMLFGNYNNLFCFFRHPKNFIVPDRHHPIARIVKKRNGTGR